MKLKSILIICIILSIISIGAVSASENITDDLAADSENVDEIAESSVDEVNQEDEDVLLTNDDQEIIADDYDYEVYCSVNDVTLNDENDQAVVYFRSYDSSQTGSLKIYVDDSLEVSETISTDDYDEDDELYKSFYLDNLDIYSAGDYTIKVTFKGYTLVEDTAHVSPYKFYVYTEEDEEDDEYGYGETVDIFTVLPEDATGKLTVSVNNKVYDVSYKDGRGMISVSTTGLNLGSYNIVARYAGDNRYPAGKADATFYVEPKVSAPDIISYGENEFITINAPAGLNGNVNIVGYKYDDYEDEYVQFTSQNIPFSNGHGSYSLSNLAVFDDYKFTVNYNIGGYNDYSNVYLEVKSNSPDFSSSLSATSIIVGNNIVVNINGPKLNDMVYIYVDDKQYKAVSLINGQVIEGVSGLAIGTHKINVWFNDGSYFYSDTKYVTVNPIPAPVKPVVKADKIKLALKKVKVKKSAKKLIIKATLKINGKKVKGKTLTLKFKGKKFKVKTNKKGVATFKIPKKVLKKLKAGKKIKYQVYYGKKTAKRTVKVKK